MSKVYQRVLLKISGECFSHDKLFNSVVTQIAQVAKSKTRIAVVIGGGNIIRGRTARIGCLDPTRVDSTNQIDPIAADRAGMLATIINGIKLADTLQKYSTPVEHFAAFAVGDFIQTYNNERAQESLTAGKVLVLSGGTGNPFFSTDSAAALRAVELKMDIILKGTRVGGVFSADPEKNPKARLYKRLTYKEALAKGLAVMDLTAFALCQTHRLPIIVFDITQPGAILKVIRGEKIGSYIC
ncbi:MAG: uridine monophosphate kinase [candidate division WOR-3 bacterium]